MSSVIVRSDRDTELRGAIAQNKSANVSLTGAPHKRGRIVSCSIRAVEDLVWRVIVFGTSARDRAPLAVFTFGVVPTDPVSFQFDSQGDFYNVSPGLDAAWETDTPGTVFATLQCLSAAGKTANDAGEVEIAIGIVS